MTGINKELEKALEQINKAYGEGLVMPIEGSLVSEVEPISTGSLLLNQACGIGGFPKGRIIEFIGVEASGKTSFALQFLAQFKGPTLFIDTEHSFDKEYAAKLGVNLDNLLISQPDYIEQALNLIKDLCTKVEVIVFDSIAASPPKVEFEGDMSTPSVGVKAKLMSQALRNISGRASKAGCTIIFTNQIREKIAVMYGSPETTPAGRAVKHHATIRVEFRKGKSIEKGEEIIGHYVRTTIKKNKVAPPFKKVEIPFIYGQGVVNEYEIMELALAAKVVTKKGAWIYHKKTTIAQGLTNAVIMMQDNPELMEAIMKDIKNINK